MDCKRTVLVDTLVRSDPFCFVDTVLTVGTIGVLTYACAGGPARIVIGPRSFDGRVDGDHLETCAGTQFLFSDGCM